MNSLNSTSTQDSLPRYFNTKQAAAYLNLSHQFLEIARHKGGGPQYVKLAKVVRYRPGDLDEWMNNHIKKHTADTSLHDACPEPTGQSLDDAVEQDDPPVIKVGRNERGGENGC